MFKEILTDPENHVSDDFVYLVHGVMLSEGAGETEIRERLGRVSDPERFYSASLVARLKPTSIATKLRSPTEVNLTRVYGGMGVVIDIPSDDVIYVASHKDLGTSMHQERLRAYALEHRGEVEDPLTILTRKLSYDPDDVVRHNELVMRGNPDCKITALVRTRSSVSEKSLLSRSSPYSTLRDKLEKQQRLFCDVVRDVTQRDLPLIEFPSPLARLMVKEGKETRKRFLLF